LLNGAALKPRRHPRRGVTVAIQVEHSSEADVLRLVVHERRLDARAAPDLKAQLASFVGLGWQWIVLDLSKVEFVDSSALGAIVSGLKMLGRSGDLVIAGARQPVVALFALTRMDKVFRMFPTAEAASAALNSRV
jgi:anti-sigma B factor antagonist